MSVMQALQLPRTFVSFSSADKGRYDLMCAWKAHEHIDFNFADFQLDEAINSRNPYYIRSVCATKVRRVDTLVLLIGSDTYTKTLFVKHEVEVAHEKGCRLIGVNLNNCRFQDAFCPAYFANLGALFVPYRLASWPKRLLGKGTAVFLGTTSRTTSTRS